MPLDPRALAFAGGLTASVLFTACALSVAIAPEATTAYAGVLLHADLATIARPLTWGSFGVGLVVWAIGTVLTFGLVAVVYNHLLASKQSAR